jgi:hypothetical protein
MSPNERTATAVATSAMLGGLILRSVSLAAGLGLAMLAAAALFSMR